MGEALARTRLDPLLKHPHVMSGMAFLPSDASQRDAICNQVAYTIFIQNNYNYEKIIFLITLCLSLSTSAALERTLADSAAM
jgi:hypothetical protein